MALSMNKAYDHNRQHDQHLAMATNCSMDQKEALQIDPRYQSGSQTGIEHEMLVNEEPGTCPSRVELLEAEIGEFGSLIESEKSKTKALGQQLDQSLQKIERLMVEGRDDLIEARIE